MAWHIAGPHRYCPSVHACTNKRRHMCVILTHVYIRACMTNLGRAMVQDLVTNVLGMTLFGDFPFNLPNIVCCSYLFVSFFMYVSLSLFVCMYAFLSLSFSLSLSLSLSLSPLNVCMFVSVCLYIC